MEIVLALVIGLTVACVVFISGRMLVGSGSSPGQVQPQPELSISASVAPDTTSGEAKSIRLTAQLSLAETASEIPVSKSTLFRWEAGQRSPRGDKALGYGALLQRLVKSP